MNFVQRAFLCCFDALGVDVDKQSALVADDLVVGAELAGDLDGAVFDGLRLLVEAARNRDGQKIFRAGKPLDLEGSGVELFAHLLMAKIEPVLQ